MEDLWDSESCDPIADIQAGLVLSRNGPSFKELHDSEEFINQLLCKVTIRYYIDESFQQQVIEMLDADSWSSRTFQLQKILKNHPEFRVKKLYKENLIQVNPNQGDHHAATKTI